MARIKGAPVVVLGMHRSGTSIVANVLHNIGISMGENFLKSDEFNPNGYFEDEDFLWINKGIIELAGGVWYDPPAVRKLKGDRRLRKIARETIIEKRQKAGRNSWGWKDPRNCLTCWVYSRELPDAKYIVTVRRLADIKLSLNTAHGHLANWNNVIDIYYDTVEEFLRTNSNLSLVVGFEELVYKKYAKDTVRKILDFTEQPERVLDKALSVIQFR